jgi:hypothetical protein
VLAPVWGGKAGGSGFIEGAERLGGSVVWCGCGAMVWCSVVWCGVVREGFQLHAVWCVIYSRVPVVAVGLEDVRLFVRWEMELAIYRTVHGGHHAQEHWQVTGHRLMC